MVTATTARQRIGITTPRVLALEAVQQSINNIRERITGVEAIADRLAAQAASVVTTQTLTTMATQIRALQDQLVAIDTGGQAVAQLLDDPDGLVVLKDGLLLTRLLVAGANVTLSSPDGAGGDIVIAATSGGLVPLTTGAEPIVLVSDGSGQCVMVPA